MFGWFKYSYKKLAKELIAICRQKMPDASFVYDPNEQQITFDESQIYLGNLFHSVENMSRKQRLAYLEQFITASFDEQPIDYDNSSHLLFPRLKTLAEYHILRTHTEQEYLLHYPFTEHFVLVLGMDCETAIKSVSDEQLSQMQLSPAEAMKHAIANLQGISDAPFEALDDGVYVSRFNDAYDAARILFIEQIELLNVKGRPVAFVPSPDHLFICGSEDIKNLELLSQRCRQIAEQSRLLSLYTLELVAGQWVDFQPPRQDGYQDIYNLHMVELSTQYAEQKALLEQVHERDGIDVFVASHMLYEQDDQPFYFSTCVWSQGVQSWLPQAETIQFTVDSSTNKGDSELLGYLSWEDCLSAFAEHFRPLGMVPERYEVVDFPDLQKLTQLIKSSQTL